MGRLTGKVAVVTGAAGGIGHAVATLFAQEGATVIATDVRPDGDLVPLDVSSEEDWRRVVTEAERAHGRVDVLVNNAGIGVAEGIVESDLASWNRVIAVSQTGAFLGMREVIPVMRRGGGGSIVNVSSIWGVTAVPGLAAYHAAKGAVRTLTKNAAISYAQDGIRVNSVHPGFVDTPMTQANDPAVNAVIIGATPLGRAGRPSEIACACLFLASGESSFVTGAELAVDGGYLAQ
ncbi:SDR family NAD(P)-dependent oxidoreductase [Amycolatopsis pithecellobii]|uniref:SDR family oxidoreductase n=1 Tax=Amycolatopsis pithecellobii TaxID=664692 RepID=A0A6N7Z0D3_9PSEU|nr:SDR family oxidoreductase [Amycolatopsis pithecellobii]MTD53211.1 SDR family oxidoreductase [Amycolatopsis pithecellobii]